MKYLDFDLEIQQGVGCDYQAAVLNSPAGQAQEKLVFPFEEGQVEGYLRQVQAALLAKDQERRRAAQSVQEFGQQLFEALFVGDLRTRYDVSCEIARREEAGLRLRFRIHPAFLASLPWEYLYDARPGEYLCLSRQTPLVRYVSLPQSIRPLQVKRPLRILGMVASPDDRQPLNVALEQGYLQEALKEPIEHGQVELSWLSGQSWRDIQRAMQGGPWHIFHFIGHGGFNPAAGEGVLMLADESGRTTLQSAQEIGRLLADHPALRMVVLNACQGALADPGALFSSTAATLARRGIPAVLAMQFQITNRAAIEMTRSFYAALAGGLPVDEAATEARKGISFARTHTLEWGTPVLYMRSPDGVLFTLPRNSPPGAGRQGKQGPAVAPVPARAAPAQAPSSKPIDTLICFSKEDTRHFEQLHTFFAQFQHLGAVSSWDPTQLAPGERPAEALANATASAKIAILLVSPTFLADQQIAAHQLPALLDAAARRGMRIISVIVRPCAFEQSPLAQFEPLNRDQPITGMTGYQQDELWQRLVLLVRDLLAEH